MIVGCVGEYIAEFKELPKDPTKRKLFEKRSLKILIGGLVIGLIGLFKTTQLAGLETAQLKTDAAKSEEHSKALEAARSELIKQIEELRSTNLLLRSNVAALELEVAHVAKNMANMDPTNGPVRTVEAHVFFVLAKPVNAKNLNVGMKCAILELLSSTSQGKANAFVLLLNQPIPRADSGPAPHRLRA